MARLTARILQERGDAFIEGTKQAETYVGTIKTAGPDFIKKASIRVMFFKVFGKRLK